jgi:hypothetical protein
MSVMPVMPVMPVLSVESSTPLAPHVWTSTEVDERLTNKVIEVMQNITRMNQSNTNLDVGVYYPLPYVQALRASQEPKFQARLNTFIEHGMAYHGYASPTYFKMVPQLDSPSGKQVMTFVLKPNVSASEALKNLQAGLSVLGCGETCQVAQYTAILDVLGPEKFDALFAADSPTPLIISGIHSKNPISKLRNYICQEKATLHDVKRGDLIYFFNASSYQDKHLIGSSQGHNSICLQEEGGDASRFGGLGWPADGLNYPQIQELMRSKYNADPVNVQKYLSAKILKNLPKQRLDLAGKQISPANFKKEGGGKIQVVCQLDALRITALANSTIAEARRLLDSYPVVCTKQRVVLPTAGEGKT